jgi:hypothetical protein
MDRRDFLRTFLVYTVSLFVTEARAEKAQEDKLEGPQLREAMFWKRLD